jgi:transcriptional regulator with GAF, ATPase, and Fis domain
MSATRAPFQLSSPPLRPSDELARVSVAQESMDSVLRRVVELARQTIPGVVEASVTLISHDRATTAAHTGRLAPDMDESQYGRGHGPCLEAAVGRELREIVDAREETRWPDHCRSAVRFGALSSLSVPLPVEQTVHGALNLYAVEPGTFRREARDLARTFASYAAVAVGNVLAAASQRSNRKLRDIAAAIVDGVSGGRAQ